MIINPPKWATTLTFNAGTIIEKGYRINNQATSEHKKMGSGRSWAPKHAMCFGVSSWGTTSNLSYLSWIWGRLILYVPIRISETKSKRRYCSRSMQKQIVGVHRFRVHRSGLSFFRWPCELAPGPSAMPQYPEIVLFSCVLPSELTNQQFRF